VHPLELADELGLDVAVIDALCADLEAAGLIAEGLPH